jgi:hypothetical protein
LSGLQWQTNGRLKPTIIGAIGCCARTDWAAIRRGSFVCSAISTAEKARADSNQLVSGKLALHCAR